MTTLKIIFEQIKSWKLQLNFIVFLIVFFVRILLVIQKDNNFLGGNDAIGYHNAAVQLTEGNSNFGFFREPGYIYFVAGVYELWKPFNEPVKEISSQNFDRHRDPEILFLQIIQAIFSSLTIVVFYALIKIYLKENFAFLIAVISGLYLPLAYLSLYLLRETVQFFILISLNWVLLKYFTGRQLKFLILSGFLWGLSNLMLQITYLLFIPVMLFFLYYIYRNIADTLKNFAFCFFFMVLTISPWLYKSYSNFHDCRIFKTMGSSYTFESINYISALLMAYDLRYITQKQFDGELDKEWYFISDSTRFQKSFSGYYRNKADSIKQSIVGSKDKFNYYRKRLYLNFRLSMLQTFFWKNQEQQTNPIKYYLYQKRIVFVIPFFIFAYLALPGILLSARRLILILPLFIFFCLLFCFIGNETRRMLFIHPFLIMFSTITAIYIYFKIFRKKENTYIQNVIFK